MLNNNLMQHSQTTVCDNTKQPKRISYKGVEYI